MGITCLSSDIQLFPELQHRTPDIVDLFNFAHACGLKVDSLLTHGSGSGRDLYGGLARLLQSCRITLSSDL